MANPHGTIEQGLIQDNKLLNMAYKKKAQQNQVLVATATQHNQALATNTKTSTKDTFSHRNSGFKTNS